MKKLLLVAMVLVVAVGALGYRQGWFRVTNQGKVDVQVDPAKFKQDKETFSKAFGEKAKATKDQIDNLWKTSESVTGDEKSHAQEELRELEKKHDRLEQQIKELNDAAPGTFESIRQDLSNTLEEVQNKIEELKRKLEKGDTK